jgi:ergothioneine biosynthesis protein EgtB
MHPQGARDEGADRYRGMGLAEFYRSTRQRTMDLVKPLSAEDCQVQSMPDVSPTKWHLAHTTWFFETFILETSLADFQPYHPRYRVLFNSYYNSVGEQHARPQRGLLSRPPLEDIFRYRAHVDDLMEKLFADRRDAGFARLVEIGLNHEEQHQELLLMDIKHVLATNPLRPPYREDLAVSKQDTDRVEWIHFDEKVGEIGHDGAGFCFDNELPRHRSLIGRHALANRCVTSGEYLDFMADGGYARPELWLSEGWDWRQRGSIKAPLYWERDGSDWAETTLGGLRAVDEAAPVVHVSYFEAEAFARWAKARLPREEEWEAASSAAESGAANDLQRDHLHPIAALARPGRLAQMLGDVWEWTQSSYAPYPGYRAPDGAIGEYNGKFMCNQYVLRGGSCVTPRGHTRESYRNFFPVHSRWAFSGIRLARDLA